MQRLFNCYFLWWGSVGAEGEIARVSAKPVTDEQGAACISPSTLCWKDTHLPDWWGALLPATSLPSFSPSPHLLPLSYTYFSLYLPLPFHFPLCHTQKQTYTHCKFTHTHAHTHTLSSLCLFSRTQSSSGPVIASWKDKTMRLSPNLFSTSTTTSLVFSHSVLFANRTTSRKQHTHRCYMLSRLHRTETNNVYDHLFKKKCTLL